jgi:NAD(P)-dependent dehydrogenase (short-subunit alcohol dehydrogenase family)
VGIVLGKEPAKRSGRRFTDSIAQGRQMKSLSLKTVVVTGVSTGIGRAAAALLVAQGFRVFGSVRRAEDGAALQRELGERFIPLLFDITDEAAVRAAAATVRDALHGATLAGLVNNAGIAIAGPLSHLPVDDFRQQLEVNVVAPMRITQIFLPLLGMDGTLRGPRGRIVNVSSNSGVIAMPFVGAYCASKHAFEGWSASLRRELIGDGIDVIVVAPGPIATPIWDKAEQVDITPYAQLPVAPVLQRFRDVVLRRGRDGLPAERVAEAIRLALTAPRPKTRYIVVGKRLADWYLPRLLPARWLDRIVARTLDLRRPAT